MISVLYQVSVVIQELNVFGFNIINNIDEVKAIGLVVGDHGDDAYVGFEQLVVRRS